MAGAPVKEGAWLKPQNRRESVLGQSTRPGVRPVVSGELAGGAAEEAGFADGRQLTHLALLAMILPHALTDETDVTERG